MWLSSYASFTRLSLRFHNGRLIRPLPLLYGYLQFKVLNLTIAGSSSLAIFMLLTSYPAFLRILAAPLISAFINVPSADLYNPRWILLPEKRYFVFGSSLLYVGIKSRSKKTCFTCIGFLLSNHSNAIFIGF